MSYRTLHDVLAEADKRGLRRAFFVTALMSEMEAVRGHLTDLCTVYSSRDGSMFECGTRKSSTRP